MGVSNYTPTGISHATSVDFSKRSVNQPVHIVQYDRSLPILAVSLYNNGQLYRLSESMDVSIRLGKPDRTFVYNKALGCDSTRTIVYFEITQQMSIFDGEYYPVIEIMDGEKIANSSTIYLIVDRNPVQCDYIESTVEYKELVNYRDEAVKAGNEAKEAAKVAKDSVQTVVDKTKEAVEAGQVAIDAANKASESAKSILGVEENVTRIGNMVSEKEPIITAAAETASTSATNAKTSETNAKASEEAAKLSETNAKQSETNAKASEEASKLSETNAKNSEDEAVKYGNLSKSYAVGTDNVIRENDAEDNAKKYCETAKSSEFNAKRSETNAKAYLDEINKKVQATGFEIDFATGELIQNTSNEYTFMINQTTGNLEWEVTV
nr:MAG TPA: L SHAPED TAIL FIBER PROTEIN [Caudoviricetes sp.]